MVTYAVIWITMRMRT